MKRFVVGSRLKRPDPAILVQLLKSSPATVGHLTDFGFPRGLRQVGAARPFAGPALTIKIPHVDSAAVHEAMSLVEAGDVIVIDQSGDDERSSFGGTLAAIAVDCGAVAVVSNARTNDVDEIAALGLPVFSQGPTPKTTRILGLEGEINMPVSVGGVVVMPGDIVFGGTDGVCIIPRSQAAAMAAELVKLEAEIEALDIRAAVRSGQTLGELLGATQAVHGRVLHV